MVRKTQGESSLQQLETRTRSPTWAQDEDWSISWLHLPSSVLGWQVPLAKASRQMLRTLPFSLGGFGELSEVVEKDDHKDILLSGLNSGSAYHVAQVGRSHLWVLGKGTPLTSVPQKVWAMALLTHYTCISAAGHRDSGEHGTFLQPKGCIQLALLGQQTLARSK